MINNSTNINKTKESLSSDDQQFHQYQQNNHLSPQIIQHKNDHDIIMALGKECGWVKWVNDPNLPLLNN
jgi:hypothetical protein